MKAVTLQGGKLSVDEIDEPKPGPGEVLVDVLTCGICGSDLSCAAHGDQWNEQAKTAFGTDLLDLERPVILGHEFVARVVEYGPETNQSIPVGTRVVSMPMLLREAPIMIGFADASAPGAYAERMLLTEALMIPVPDELSTEVAALTEPLAVALHSLYRIDGTTADAPLVVGCGPIGLAVIAILKAKGIGPIVASDLSPERRKMAKELGADVVVDPREASPYEALLAAAATDDPEAMAPPGPVTGLLPLRPTIAFECTGAPGVLQTIAEGLPPNGRIAVAGINLGSDSIEPSVGIFKEIDVRFCLAYTPEEFAETLDMLVSGQINAEAMITGKVDLDGVADAFEKLANSPTDAKVLIDWKLAD